MDLSNHKIMLLEHEKRERVLMAALSEFAKGYKQASTDTIVKTAGISKGLLFHYFGTKKDLLEFLYHYTQEFIGRELIDKIDFDEPDLLTRLWKMTALKMEAVFQYPAIFDFLVMVFLSSEPELAAIKEKVNQKYDLTWTMGSQLFTNLDPDLLKEGLDPEITLQVILHTFSGYSQTVIELFKARPIGSSVVDQRKELDDVLAQTKIYMDFFRTTFYKKGSN